jgi:hypothetical protein
MALYGVGLIVLLVAVARETLTLGTGVLVLAGTVGGIRLSRKGASNRGAGAGVLRRTLCRLGAQMIVAALVLIDDHKPRRLGIWGIELERRNSSAQGRQNRSAAAS